MTEIFKDRTVITMPAISHIEDFRKYSNALVELMKIRNEELGDRAPEMYLVLDLLQHMMDVKCRADITHPPRQN